MSNSYEETRGEVNGEVINLQAGSIQSESGNTARFSSFISHINYS